MCGRGRGSRCCAIVGIEPTPFREFVGEIYIFLFFGASMLQPNKWIFGLVPLIPLWFFANYTKTSDVEADLGARASAAVNAQLDKGAVSVAGRDVTLSGAAFSEQGKNAIADAVRAQFGVRLVNDSSTLIPEAKPYTWSASRDGDKITLSGSVPDPATRQAILKVASEAVPGAQVADTMIYARGMGTFGFATAAAFGIKELGSLNKGEVGLSNSQFSIKGEAPDSIRYLAAVQGLSTLPEGIKLEAADILPPSVPSYTISAVKSDGGIVLSGFAPSADAEAKFVTAAKAAVQGGNVTDQLQIARGLAPGLDFAALTTFMAAELGNLKTGEAKFSGGVLSIKGEAPSAEALKAAMAGLATGAPAGVKLAASGIVGPTPVPEPAKVPEPEKAAEPAKEAQPGKSMEPMSAAGEYNFAAVRAGDTLTLTGNYPDDDSHEKILGVIKSKFFGITLVDQTKIVEGAPKNFAQAAMSAVSQLSRLASGSATISNSHISLTGEALYDAASRQINSNIVTALPSGFVGESAVTTRAAAAIIQDPAKCQIVISDLLKLGKIRFETGKASIHPDSFGFLDAVVAEVGRCPTTNFEVGGYTDNVGAPGANLELSRLRAQTTADYLAKAGIPAERLTAVGHGETNPIASNDTDDGKAQNRRIEFLVK